MAVEASNEIPMHGLSDDEKIALFAKFEILKKHQGDSKSQDYTVSILESQARRLIVGFDSSCFDRILSQSQNTGWVIARYDGVVQWRFQYRENKEAKTAVFVVEIMKVTVNQIQIDIQYAGLTKTTRVVFGFTGGY